jgi:hypothetical protein
MKDGVYLDGEKKKKRKERRWRYLELESGLPRIPGGRRI